MGHGLGCLPKTQRCSLCLVEGQVLCRPGTRVVAITWSPDGRDVCIAYADGFVIRGGFAGDPAPVATVPNTCVAVVSTGCPSAAGDGHDC